MKFIKVVNALASCSMMVLLSSGMTQAVAHSSDKNAKVEGEAIAFVMAVDKFEISAADEVSKKDVSSDVADYAKMLHTDHEKNLQDMTDLSKSINVEPADTSAIKHMEDNGDKELKHLDTLKGKKFEAAYLNAMVKGHKDALAKIDMYLKKVKNDSVKKSLEETRKAVAGHLEQAKKLQSANK